MWYREDAGDTGVVSDPSYIHLPVEDQHVSTLGVTHRYSTIVAVVGAALLGSLGLFTVLGAPAAFPIATDAHYRDTRPRHTAPATALSNMTYPEWSFGSKALHGTVPSQDTAKTLLDPVHNDSKHNGALIEKVRFSPFTLATLKGFERLRHDDALCTSAARYPDYDVRRCLGAPYLYVTFHGGYKNKRIKTVCKYTRDGCSLGSALMPSALHDPHSLRGMAHDVAYLLVAEAWKEKSRVLRYSRCNPELNHRRELLEILVDATNKTSDADGMIHPYGFAKKRGNDPYVYVSAQGTNSVLRFRRDSGSVGPLAPALRERKDASSCGTKVTATAEMLKAHKQHTTSSRNDAVDETFRYYNGTFACLGKDEVRGIAFDDQELLYVANKQKGVMVFDKDGYMLGMLPGGISTPISIYFCAERSSLWVGAAGSHELYEYDVFTWELLQKIKHRSLKHPAGFVAYGDSLFVVSQRRNQLLEFSMMTGKLKNVVLPDLPDAGERILLSPC